MKNHRDVGHRRVVRDVARCETAPRRLLEQIVGG